MAGKTMEGAEAIANRGAHARLVGNAATKLQPTVAMWERSAV